MVERLTSLRALLIASALIELAAGAALLCMPREAVVLLTSVAIEEPAATTITRIAGSGLFALAVACWLGRNEPQNSGGLALLTSMSTYNFAVACILGWAGIRAGLNGLLLWPGVALHSAMLIWCVYGIRSITKLNVIGEPLQK